MGEPAFNQIEAHPCRLALKELVSSTYESQTDPPAADSMCQHVFALALTGLLARGCSLYDNHQYAYAEHEWSPKFR